MAPGRRRCSSMLEIVDGWAGVPWAWVFDDMTARISNACGNAREGARPSVCHVCSGPRSGRCRAALGQCLGSRVPTCALAVSADLRGLQNPANHVTRSKSRLTDQRATGEGRMVPFCSHDDAPWEHVAVRSEVLGFR
jgi:hypothetical protein